MPKYRFDQIAINSKEKKKPVESDRFTYVGLEHLDAGSLRVKRFGADVAPVGEKLIMHKGDVLFGKRRAYQKKVAIAPFDGIFSAHGMVLRPCESVVCPDFFPFFIASDYFLDAAIKISVGSLSPTINWKDLAQLEFSLPDLDVQKRLAEILWAMTEASEAYSALIAKTDELIKSQFIEMFGAPETNPYRWPIYNLGDILDVKPQNGLYKPQSEYVQDGSGTPILRIDAFYDGKVTDYSSLKRLRCGDGEKNRYLLYENDIVINRVNSIEYLGKSALIVDMVEDTVFESNMMRFHVDERRMDPTFLIQLLCSKFIYTQILSRAKRAANQASINQKDVENFSVIVPPMELQIKFANYLSQLDKSKFVVQKATYLLHCML